MGNAAKISRFALPAVERQILLVRGQRVLLGQQLAVLYGVETRVLMQAVQRNRERFPDDFMFELDRREIENLKSQIVTSSWGGLRKPPYAFTEQGVAMLSSVLHSERAVAVNIEIMRAFVKLRALIADHQDLRRKLASLERKYDAQFKVVFDVIRELMEPAGPPVRKRRIGFHEDERAV